MLRSRGGVRSILAVAVAAAEDAVRHPSKMSTTSPNSTKNRKRVRRRISPIILQRLVLFYIICSMIRFYWLLSKNMRGGSPSTSGPVLRGQTTTNKSSSSSSCPALPERLQKYEPTDDPSSSSSPPLIPMTKEQMTKQLEYMEEITVGTTGNRILQCPSQQTYGIPCRGVLKVYRHQSVYQQVKRCLTLLETAGIGARILYADDATATMVEEDMGRVTMMNAPIPLDFDVQLRRIRCLLQEHSILHRDLNWRNFLVDKPTGKVVIIDFGDAFVWNGGGVWNRQNYSYRNVVNLFNIWWRSHDEDASLERMIAFTIPEIKGDRQWRPPALATSTLHHWNSLSQHRMGALLLPNQVSGNTNNMVNIQPKEHQQPPDKTLQVPEQWKQVMPGFKGSTTHA